MLKNTDIQELRSTLVKARAYFVAKRNSLTKPAEIVSALVDETLRQIENGYPLADIIFSYVEIHRLVWGNAVSNEAASKKVRSHKEKITELLNEQSELSLFLKEQGATSLLVFQADESKGGAGATTNMWLGLTGDSADAVTLSSNSIQYLATRLDKPYFWVEPFTNMTLKGQNVMRFWFVILLIILGIPFLFLSLTKNQSVGYLICAGLTIFFLYRIGHIIYELLEKGVAKAPDWTVRIAQQNALFVTSRENVNDGENKGHKTIELVTYEANCAICGDLVFIENGGREFNGRYIGKCTLSPMEHVFTFDHVTKVGKPLR